MIKNLSIRIKIILAQVFLVALVSVFIYSYYPGQQKQEALKSIESKIQSIGNMFSIGVGIGMGETDLVAVSEALDWAHSDNSVVYISVRNTTGQELSSYIDPALRLPVEVTGNAVKDKVVEYGNVLYFQCDIVYQNLSFGTLVIGYSLDALEQVISKLKRTTFYFCLALFLTGVVLSVAIGNMITGNVRALDTAVRAISSGDEHIRVPVKSNDEIGKLGKAFNSMLRRLDKSRDELVQHSEQLKRQNDELNQFSYVVSHDLKAPLRAIFKLSEWIEEDSFETLSEDSKVNLKTLRRRIFRMESLINGLLEYSKIGRSNIQFEPVDLKTMIRETIDLINPPAHFEINIEAELPVFKTKKILLQQVFMNLISNAIKYNDKAKGIINISASQMHDFFQFSVEDNGPGIDPKYHKKVFEIFQTLESRDKVEGTGIGLSIIKKCVEDMNGEINLESEVGSGARFTFTWRKEKNESLIQNQYVNN